MRASDILSGALFFALGVFIFVYAIQLPPMPGQRYGAGAFPTLIGLGLAGFSLLLMVQAWRKRGGGIRWLALASWARDRAMLLNFALALALILVYVVLSERVGFIPLSIAMLLALFLRQGVRPLTALIVAVAATLAIQILFVDLLRVPLPRGILTEFMW